MTEMSAHGIATIYSLRRFYILMRRTFPSEPGETSEPVEPAESVAPFEYVAHFHEAFPLCYTKNE